MDTTKFSELANRFDRDKFKTLHEEMTFPEYLARIYQNPKLIRTAYQRIYDMIVEAGTEKRTKHRKTYIHYNFFDDLEIPIYGHHRAFDELLKFFRGAAGGYGTEKRVLLLHGPVGSAKSTICRRLKRGMEKYSNTDAGTLYTYKWINLPTGQDGIYTHAEDMCPMRDDPIKLVPLPMREEILRELNEIHLDQTPEANRISAYTLRANGELNPRCKFFMEALMNRNGGDWGKVVQNHIRVVRMVYSEADRQGIATFQPKDEKNQDATELTGDINFNKLSHFGSDSDPRAFNFDGEFEVGNRGVVEFIEVLKLAKEFLYDLLGASQEQNIKPKKFAQISVDFALLGHTNAPEFAKLQGDETMEALRDRTVKVDIPYLLEWTDEIKVLEQDYGPGHVRQHVAPHTLEIAALWAILTRLQNHKEGKLKLVDKAKLYDGRAMPGWTEDAVKELQTKYPEEGMKDGMSARYVQDKISNCLSSHHDYINPFMVMNEIKDGLTNTALISSPDLVARYVACVEMAVKELDDILKTEVQRALVGDEDAIVRLCTNYIDNVSAYLKKSKIPNPYTGRDEEPDERLMRAIEEKIGIPEQGSDDHRLALSSFIGQMALDGKKFRWDSNAKLKKALEQKLYEDTRDHIKLSALNMAGASVVDKDQQAKIDAIKQRLIKNFGYNEASATDVLRYVSSLFARGDVEDDG